MAEHWNDALRAGQVIPASPLALNDDGSWSERHQRALIRYYVAAGAGGLAVGVHSTQFAIRDSQYGLFRPLLELTTDCLQNAAAAPASFARIAGICGSTVQAVGEAEFAADLGFHAGLVSFTALSDRSEAELVDHLQLVSRTIPVVGFYLQPSVGGRLLSYAFWRRACELPGLAAIKMAPFNRYQTWDVIRAVMDSGRDDVALYTGNDDNIITDLLTRWTHNGKTRFIVGGLLGQWGIGTQAAVQLLNDIKQVRTSETIPAAWLSRNAELTDLNAALFDAANSFAGCIPGINEMLRRDGLTPSARCLDPDEVLSPGQSDELDRVTAAYPHLLDRRFVAEHLAEWLD